MYRRTIYYVVRPRDELLSALARFSTDAKDVLGEAELWCDEEVPHGNLGQTAVSDWLALRDARVKAAFLMHVIDQFLYGDATDPVFQRGLAEVLGYPTVGIRDFDRLWSLERFEGASCDVARVLEQAPLPVVRSIKGSEIAGFDEWQSRIVEERMSKEDCSE